MLNIFYNGYFRSFSYEHYIFRIKTNYMGERGGLWKLLGPGLLGAGVPNFKNGPR